MTKPLMSTKTILVKINNLACKTAKVISNKKQVEKEVENVRVDL